MSAIPHGDEAGIERGSEAEAEAETGTELGSGPFRSPGAKARTGAIAETSAGTDTGDGAETSAGTNVGAVAEAKAETDAKDRVDDNTVAALNRAELWNRFGPIKLRAIHLILIGSFLFKALWIFHTLFSSFASALLRSVRSFSSHFETFTHQINASFLVSYKPRSARLVRRTARLPSFTTREFQQFQDLSNTDYTLAAAPVFSPPSLWHATCY